VEDKELMEEYEEIKNSNVVNMKPRRLRKYFNEKTFIPKRLADEIVEKMPVFNDGISLYAYENGFYASNARLKIRQLAQKKLDEEARRNRIEEVIYNLETNHIVDPASLNKDDTTINVKNGLLNWKTGELKKHTHKHLSTIQIPVDYDPKAKCPKFDEFLEMVVPKDAIMMIHEIIGYMLIPKTNLEKAFMFTGTGSNGKSTLLYVIEELIGERNISNVTLQDLESNRFKKALLYGKLANISADLPSKLMEGSSAFKRITTGDKIDAEFKGQDGFTFTPFCKLIFSANELPSSTELGDSFFRRWEIINFPRKFKDSEKKPGLKYEITIPQEMSGILNHAIDGLIRITEAGTFTESKTSIEQKELYEKQADNVLSFVDEECFFGATARAYTKQLYREYTDWAHDNGYKPLGKKKFHARLTAKYPDIYRGREYGESEHWQGIGLKSR
jgi:putative DNA primase/helicase